MSSERIILVLGADTHAGSFFAQSLAHGRHAVYACLPDICGTNTKKAHNLIEAAFADSLDLHVLALDELFENKIEAVINQVRLERGKIDLILDASGTKRVPAHQLAKLVNEISSLSPCGDNQPLFLALGANARHEIVWKKCASPPADTHYAKIKP
jgi:NAD(P)-dependent dehydrogenase (short-subunit alcohol dehydrogenase family)